MQTRRNQTAKRCWPGCVLALGLWAVAALPGRADVVITKDGFTLHGKVGIEQAAIEDPNGGFIPTIKSGGFSFVEDGARGVIFSPSYRQVGDARNNYDRFENFVTFKTKPLPGSRNPYPPIGLVFKKVTEFDAKWMRMMSLADATNPTRVYELKQQVETLTPHYVRMISPSHAWSASYLTQEIGYDMVMKLLKTHPELQEEPGKPEWAKRAKVALFLIQAQWYKQAEDAINQLAKDFPDEKEKLLKLRQDLRNAETEFLINELERAQAAGQYLKVQDLLKRFPKDGVAANLNVRYTTLKAQVEDRLGKVERAAAALDALRKIPLTGEEVFLQDAVLAVRKELHPEAIDRLDTFLTLYEQYSRDVEKGKPPTYKPGQLLALAVSGWLLGKSSAEATIPKVRKLWDSRLQLADYLQEDNRTKRLGLLAKWESDKELPPFDELAQMLLTMPPPVPNQDMTTELKEYNTGYTVNNPNGVPFALKLPPEFHPARKTPLLILIPDGSEKPAELLAKFGDLPARHGYIVAIPIWNAGFKSTYQYQAAERESVYAVLQYVSRFLPVDRDRVFAFGCNEAANLCVDATLSRPDLFAGAVYMCPSPRALGFKKGEAGLGRLLMMNYWRNAQQMPVYMVLGDRTPKEFFDWIVFAMKKWMPKGYPVLATTYRGRHPEWFSQELPFLFDWMSRKKRATGFPEVGTRPEFSTDGDEMRTLRQEDNGFYWLKPTELAPTHSFSDKPSSNTVPARVYGRALEGNVLKVDTVGVRQISVFIPRGSLEPEKPFKIILNKNDWTNDRKPLQPKLSVMLEHAYETADRQRIIIDRIDFKGSPFLPTR